MPRDDRERLEDMLQAMDAAQSFASGLSLEALRADPRTVAALKYELLVLGEAVTGLSDDLKQTFPELPWAQIRALRNVVAHEYFRVDVQVLYTVVTGDLPVLRPRLAEMLAALDEAGDGS